MKDSLLRLFFPPKCIFCRELLAREEYEICDSCMDRIVLAGEGRITHKGAWYHSAVFALWYEDDVRDALHRFKFSGRQHYAAPLARILSHVAEDHLEGEYAAIIPVPTNPKRVRQRGYDHTLLLARELAAFTGKPVLQALGRVRETRPMFGLKPAERRANILGAFALSCPPQEVEGKTLLLVDDILTTGSTASECAAVLREYGAEKVILATVAAIREK